MIARLSLPVLVAIAFVSPAASAIPDSKCLECHGKPGFSKKVVGGRPESLHVDSTEISASVHAKLACVDCHAQMVALPHKPVEPTAVDCAHCHASSAAMYARSVHGVARTAGDSDAPGCIACHGSHAVQAIKERTTDFRRELVAVCLRCHTNERIVARHNLPRSAVIVAYQTSVHGTAVEKGSKAAPTCADCHGSHSAGPVDGSRSAGDGRSIADLCGRCHKAELDQYRVSVHATANNPESPTCTSCHGEHQIQAKSDPRSSVSRENIPRTCSTCHEALDIQTKHSLPKKRLESYEKSYHGTLVRLGKPYAAECASCHGYHDIRASSDPASRINPANLASTCGACHPADPSVFASLKVHSGLDTERPRPFLVRLLDSPWIWMYSTVIFTVLCVAAALLWRFLAQGGDRLRQS